MRYGGTLLALASAALMLSVSAALAQIKTTNQGISDTEIVVGTHEVLTGPGSAWGVPVANGMKMAVEEINLAGGVNGRKIKLIIEDSGYDPKRAVLATQKLIDRDQIFSMIGAMGSPYGSCRSGFHAGCGRDPALSTYRCRVHLKARPCEAPGSTEIQ